tara:strand:- start:183 stop:632 length:450 start_codon:yes stop_codon:yes gene_type:complete
MKILHVNSEKDLKKFNNTVKNGKMLVVFVANWCGYCKYLKPIWKKMEKTMKKSKCVKKGIIAMIYSDYKDKVQVPSNCDGYPTIRLFKDGKKIKDWEGDWMKKGSLEKFAEGFFKEKSSFTRRKSTFKKRRTKRRKKRRRNRTIKKRKY